MVKDTRCLIAFAALSADHGLVLFTKHTFSRGTGRKSQQGGAARMWSVIGREVGQLTDSYPYCPSSLAPSTTMWRKMKRGNKTRKKIRGEISWS